MKRSHLILGLLLFAILAISAISIPGGKQLPNKPSTINYALDTLYTQSDSNCIDPGDSRTRYFNVIKLNFGFYCPDGPSPDSITFDMVLDLPGNACANGTPTSTLAQSVAGALVPSSAYQWESFSEDGSSRVRMNIRTSLNLHSTTDGGLCVVIETIDPKSNEGAILLGLGNSLFWQNGKSIPLLQNLSVLSVSPVSTAPFPNCEDCLDFPIADRL